jgi:uncharacterized protein
LISLPDVGVLVALFDPAHMHHEVAHQWLEAHREGGWATCAPTENGLVAVLSNPSYPGRRTTVDDAFERLRAFVKSGHHHFWPGSTSLRRTSRIDTRLLTGHEQIQSAYLLLLAVENEGCLVTFDRDVPRNAVPRAEPEQVVVLR